MAPVFFKTVRGGDGLDDKQVFMTEDSYFCLLAKDNGAKIYADCSVQCKHEDDNGTHYYFHEDMGLPCWETNERGIQFWPRVVELDGPETKQVKSNGRKNGKVKFNLGSGGVNKKGFVNMDLNTECDFRCDVRDLRPAIAKYGQADAIEADHVLEHINRMAVTTVFRNWLKALKPGGKLTVSVPDAIAAMNDFIEADSNGNKFEDYNFKEAVVFGAQRYPGDDHRTAITENKMNKVISSCRNMIDKYDIKRGRFKGKNQDEIIVTVTKKKAKKERGSNKLSN
jgi:predicted SAM-dependent methyltransferase